MEHHGLTKSFRTIVTLCICLLGISVSSSFILSKSPFYPKGIVMTWGEWGIVQALSPYDSKNNIGRHHHVELFYKSDHEKQGLIQIVEIIRDYTQTHKDRVGIPKEIQEVMLHLMKCNTGPFPPKDLRGCGYEYPQHLTKIMTCGTPEERVIGALIIREFCPPEFKRACHWYRASAIMEALRAEDCPCVPRVLALKALGELREASEYEKNIPAEKTYIKLVLSKFNDSSGSEVYRRCVQRAVILKVKLPKSNRVKR